MIKRKPSPPPPPKPKLKTPTLPPNPEKRSRGRPKKFREYKGMTTREELYNLFPLYLQKEIEKVKSILDARHKKGVPIDDEVRKQVAKLCIMSDNVIDQTPISILLDLPERLVNAWKEQHAVFVYEEMQRSKR
jgi:hypothetical protein